MGFKTAAELGLEEEHYCALVKTIDALENGHIKHTGVTFPFRGGKAEGPSYFNMSVWRTYTNCGTVCCIGGAAELLGNLPYDSLAIVAGDAGSDSDLCNLFYPDTDKGAPEDWNSIQPWHAAKAIRNFLSTGTVNWPDAMKAREKKDRGRGGMVTQSA